MEMPPGPNESLLFQNVLDLGGKCCNDLEKTSLPISLSLCHVLALFTHANKSKRIYIYMCVYVHKTEQINKHSNNYYIYPLA